MVFGKADLTVDENVYFTMQQRLVGYFMTKPEAEERHVSAEVLDTLRRKGRRRLRSGSKLAGHDSVNIEWKDYDSGEVLGEAEVKIPKFIRSKLCDLAERSRQKVKNARAGKTERNTFS